jgi:integrase
LWYNWLAQPLTALIPYPTFTQEHPQMPKLRLTALGVERLKSPKAGRLEIFDALLPGLGLRVTDKGRKTFFVMTMVGTGEAVRDGDGNIVAGRRLKRITLQPTWPALTLDQAREQARAVLHRVAKGEDPDAPKPAPVPTWRQYVEGYLQRHKGSLGASTLADLTSKLAQMSRWDHLPLDAIRRADVLAFVEDTAVRAPIHANRQLAAIKTLYNDAVRRGVVEANPAAPLKPPSREVARDRALSDMELGWFWTATERLDWAYRGALRMLLLTGQRRGMVQHMTWDELDLERRTWTVRAAKMKTGKVHEIALNDLAMEVLTEARPITSGVHDLVLTNDGRPLGDFSHAKSRVDAAMAEIASRAIPAWRIHDLRRSMVHGLAEMGFAPHIADKILAHSSGAISGVAAVYNRFEYANERRDALCAWGRKIEVIIGRRPSNVTPLAANL